MRSGCFMSWIMVRRIVVRRRWSGCSARQKDHLGPHARDASWLNQVEIYFSIIQGKTRCQSDSGEDFYRLQNKHQRPG